MTAGRQKDFPAKILKIGFLAQADRFNTAIAKNEILAPAKTVAEMQTVAIVKSD